MPLSHEEEETLERMDRRFGKNSKAGPNRERDGVDVNGDHLKHMLAIFTRLADGPMPAHEMNSSSRRRRQISERRLIRQARPRHPAGSQRGTQSRPVRRMSRFRRHMPIVAAIMSLIFLIAIIAATAASHGNHGSTKRPACVVTRGLCYKIGPSAQSAQSASGGNANTNTNATVP